MLIAYRAQDWKAAEQALAGLGHATPAFGLGALYALYGERIAALAADPPGAGWDGVFAATEK